MNSENCKNCKKSLQSDWSFCPNCGTAQHETSIMQEYLRSPDTADEIPARQKNTAEKLVDKIFLSPNDVSKKDESKSNKDDISKYGAGVRRQVFEVIVRQAIAGAPWKEICEGPMLVNNITAEEVEEEVRKRGGGGAPASSRQPKTPSSPDGEGNAVMTISPPSQRINRIRRVIEKLASYSELDSSQLQKTLSDVALELHSIELKVQKLQMVVISDQSETQLQGDLNRELGRRPELEPGEDKGPHHIT